MKKVKKSVAPILVKMKKGEKKADVHPKEVENYESHGWVKA